MLIVKEVLNSYDLVTYFFEKYDHKLDHKKFLTGLSRFFNIFYTSGFYHPDFHLGNILYNPEHANFILIDVYGVKKVSRITNSMKVEMGAILLALRMKISFHELKDFIMGIGLFASYDELELFWQKVWKRELDYLKKSWGKRKKQILEGYSKFVDDCDEYGLFLRKTLSRDLYFYTYDLSEYNSKHLPVEKGKLYWLNSFFLQRAGIPHNLPIAINYEYDKTYTLKHSIDEILFIDKDELIQRCKLFLIDTTNIDEYIITEGDYSYLSDDFLLTDSFPNWL
jgi:hypothetical protein